MLILVCADQRSATNYLATIVQLILTRAGFKTCFNDDRFAVQSNTRNTVYNIHREFVGIMVQHTLTPEQLKAINNSGLTGGQALSFSQSYTAEEVLENTNLLQTHIFAGAFEKTKLWPELTRLVYGHRDGRDSTTSALRYHALSDDKDYSRAGGVMQSKNHRQDTAYWYYGIRESDIIYSTYTISWQIDRWRKHVLDSYILHEKYPEKMFYTYFRDFTGDNELKTIEDIIDNLGLDIDLDAQQIYDEIKHKKQQNKQKKTKNVPLNMLATSKKYNKAQGFMPAENVHFMDRLAGDALVCGDYMELADISPYIAANDHFVLLMNQDVTSLQKEMILYFFKHCDKTVKTILYSPDALAQHVLEDEQSRYIICSEDIVSYARVLKQAGREEGKEYAVYPYYEIYNRTDFFVFDANGHKPRLLSELFGKKIAVVTLGIRAEFRDIPLTVFHNNNQQVDLYIKSDNYLDCLSPASRKILIFGAGNEGRFLRQFTERNHPDIEVVGFVDSFAQKGQDRCDGLPVYRVRDVPDLDVDEVVITSIHYRKMKEELSQVYTGPISVSKISFDRNYYSPFPWGQNFTVFEEFSDEFIATLREYDCVLLAASCLDYSYYGLRELVAKHKLQTYSLFPHYDLDFVDIEGDKQYLKLYDQLK